MTNQFGEQLRKLRQRSTDCTEGSQQALTQSAFVEQLYQIIGLIYTDSAVSNWERGINKISHENRALLIGIVKVLFKCGGLKRVEDANQLLASGGYSSLTNEEIEGINSAWLQGGRQAYLDTITPSMAAQLANLPILSGLVDMETTIVDVVRRLAERSASRHVVLTGRKGVGKSSVANAVVRRFVQTSTFTHLIWFSIEDKTDIAQSFIDFVGGKLKVNGTTPLAFKVQLYQLNVALQQHPCLIVIDGLQTLADLSDALAVINQLPPPTRVLFTSRLAPSVEALENIDVVPILELNAADAQTLLQMRNPALTADHCQAVYEQLGGHPETLQLLATYSRKWPIHRILTAFEQAQEGMIERHFDTIYAEIWASLSADTQRLLQTLCFVAATGVSEEMLRVAGSFSDAQIWTAVEEADQFGLLVAHGSPDTFWYSIHHLTRQFVRSHSALLHENALAVMQYWQHRFEVLAPAEWHLLEHDRHNLFQAVQFSLELADDHPDLQQMVYKLAGLLYRFVGQRGFGNQWLPIHEALTVVSWLDERQRAVRLNQLGSLYREQQQFDVAIFTHKQAAQHAEAVSDAQLLARVDYNIAIAHRRAARYAEAAHYAEAAFRRFTHSQPEEAMRIFNLLGTISRHQGAFEEAKGYFQKSLDQLSSDVSDLVHGRILINLGNVLREQGAFLEARQQLSKAETLLPAVPTTLHYTLWLAQVRLLMAQGETEQALALLERFDIKQLQQAGLYLYSGLALHNRAEAFVLQGYFGKGETAVRQAADIWRLLEDNGRLATSLKVLGDTFFERRRSKQAAQIYEEVRTLARPYSKDYYLQGMIKEIEMKLDLLLRGDNGG